MAENENENENESEVVEEQSGGGKTKMIVLGVAAVVLLAIGVFAGPAIMNMISPPEEVTEEAADQGAPSTDPALYTSLHPPLVVNFADAAGDAHFMQITMEVMSRDQNVINSIREHVAVIRNSLILLYSAAVYEEVTTRDGKEQMLADGLAEIQAVMQQVTGQNGVEAVYFTSLVIQ